MAQSDGWEWQFNPYNLYLLVESIREGRGLNRGPKGYYVLECTDARQYRDGILAWVFEIQYLGEEL